jgi:hypothetical protein
MSDIFSSASLFFAVVGLLYSAWYGEIRDALELKKAPKREDRKPEIRKMKSAQRSKAIPLALVATVFAAVLIPDYLKILLCSWQLYSSEGFGAIRSYSAVCTLFSAMVVITCILSIHTWHLVYRLRRTLIKFRS